MPCLPPPTPSPCALIRPGSEFPQLFLARKFFLNSCVPVLTRGCADIVSSHLEGGEKKKKGKKNEGTKFSTIDTETPGVQCNSEFVVKKHNILVTPKNADGTAATCEVRYLIEMIPFNFK